MERAPLRPVPSRPPRQVDPAEAIRHVRGELSALDAPAAEAFALIALAGRSRAEVAGGAGLSAEALADALARARKALRRRLHPLPGSGWCERAERLISDRIDDALEDPGPARLEVHLANCSRCVEHERRLAQAQDALVAGFVESTAPRPQAEPEPEADVEAEAPDERTSVPAAPLRIVEASRVAGPAPDTETTPEPKEAPAPPEIPLLGADAPIALPPAPETPALPEAEEPAALPEPEEPVALPEAEAPAAIPEPEEPVALPEAEEPAAIPEPEEPVALPEAEEPVALPEAEEPVALPEAEEPAAIPEPEEPVALPEAEEPAAIPEPEEEPPAIPPAEEPQTIPEADRAPSPPAARPPVDRGGTPAPSSPAPYAPPRQAPPRPAPPRSRLAATYAPVPAAPGERDVETWAAVGPVLILLVLGIALLAFTLVIVGL